MAVFTNVLSFICIHHKTRIFKLSLLFTARRLWKAGPVLVQGSQQPLSILVVKKKYPCWPKGLTGCLDVDLVFVNVLIFQNNLSIWISIWKLLILKEFESTNWNVYQCVFAILYLLAGRSGRGVVSFVSSYSEQLRTQPILYSEKERIPFWKGWPAQLKTARVYLGYQKKKKGEIVELMPIGGQTKLLHTQLSVHFGSLHLRLWTDKHFQTLRNAFFSPSFSL